MKAILSIYLITVGLLVSLGASSAKAQVSIADGYAIITSSDIRAASQMLEQFAWHKQSRNFSTYIFDENDWNGNGLTGEIAAEALRNFLKQIENQYNLRYVLIIGDPRVNSGPVPMKAAYPRNTGSIGQTSGIGISSCSFSQMQVPTDYYYAELDGNWDLDGDGLYGEFGQYDAIGSSTGDFGIGGISINLDLSVGRIPVYSSDSDPSLFASNIVKLDHILKKIITYQSQSPESIGWRFSALIATEGANRIFYGESLMNDVFLQKGINTVDRIYDSADCTLNGNCNPLLNSQPTYDHCTISNVQNTLQTADHGLVTWLTHGGGTGAAAVMNTSTVSSLDDSKPFITFQASCLNSQVTNINNLSYSLLVNGAIATVGATEISHGPGSPVNLTSDAHKSGNAGMGYAFNLAVVEGYSVGDALMNVRENAELYGRCWYWQNQLGFNLYGDPEVGLYDSDSTNVPTLPFFMMILLAGIILVLVERSKVSVR